MQPNHQHRTVSFHISFLGKQKVLNGNHPEKQIASEHGFIQTDHLPGDDPHEDEATVQMIHVLTADRLFSLK